MKLLIRKARIMQLNLIELHENENSKQVIFKDITFKVNSSIKNLSKKVRNYLGIDVSEQKKWKSSDKALRQWREAIESCGVFIFKDSFKQSNFSGFCLYDQNFPIIYLNSKQTTSRQIFTLFHELAHILFRTSGFDPVDEYYFKNLRGSNKKIEQMCNEFSGAFLIPEESLIPQDYISKNIDISFIDQQSKEYSVSPEVFLRRLLKKRIITQSIYDNLVQKAQQRYNKLPKKKSAKISPFIVKESQLGKKYIYLVFKKYYNNQISVEQLSDFIGMKPDSALLLEPNSRIKK